MGVSVLLLFLGSAQFKHMLRRFEPLLSGLSRVHESLE